MLSAIIVRITWKVSDCRHITFLVCISNAQVLTKSVKNDQSEDIHVPDPSIPEWPFVKFAHRHSFAFSCCTSSLLLNFLSRCFFCAAVPTNWMPGKGYLGSWDASPSQVCYVPMAFCFLLWFFRLVIIGLWVLQENNTLELANKSTHTGYKHKPYNYNTVQCHSLVFDSVPNWN